MIKRKKKSDTAFFFIIIIINYFRSGRFVTCNMDCFQQKWIKCSHAVDLMQGEADRARQPIWQGRLISFLSPVHYLSLVPEWPPHILFLLYSSLLLFSLLEADMQHVLIPSNAVEVVGLQLLWSNAPSHESSRCSQQPLRTLWSRWGTRGGWFPSRAWARQTDISLSAWWPRREGGTSGRRTNMAPHHSRSRTYLWEKRRSLQVRVWKRVFNRCS